MKRTLSAVLLAAAVSLAAPSFALTQADGIGEPGVANNFTRTIHVTPETRSINVYDYETVNLEVDGKTTTWQFDGTRPVVNLQDIVPGAPSINIYVQPSDRYAPDSGGGS